MRFIGGKSLLLDNINHVISENTKGVKKVADLFSGSGVVSTNFKAQGFEVVSNDIMYMSYCLVRGLTEFNVQPMFDKLSIFNPIEYLNHLEPAKNKSEYFIYNNYSPNETCNRMYFQNENALKIDCIRLQIEDWFRDTLISESEYYYLLASLISAVPYVANITGVYAAYLKHWDKRTYNTLELKPLEIIESNKHCRSYNMDALNLVKQESFDLVYIDTPYNQRQYTPNYHILETIARYDNPKIKGVTGMRSYDKSAYCSRSTAQDAFHHLFRNLKAHYAVVSYNNESILTTEEMLGIFKQYGKIKLFEYPYRRYKSKIPNDKSGLKEQIYFVEMN